MYDGEKWDHDFDPDIDRFSSLFDNLQNLSTASTKDMMPNELPPKVDTEQSLSSLLSALAEGSKKHDGIIEVLRII